MKFFEPVKETEAKCFSGFWSVFVGSEKYFDDFFMKM